MAHVNLGLQWWQCIVAVTLAFRFSVLPLNVSLVRNTLRLHQIKPQIVRLRERMNSEVPEEKLDAAMALVALFKEKKCHPLKNIISPFLFPPLFLSLFGAVYDISAHHPEATSGGALWFPDLSAPDPTFVLPVLSALSWLATIEMAAGEHFPLKPWILSATRLGAIAFIPVTMTLPAVSFLLLLFFFLPSFWCIEAVPLQLGFSTVLFTVSLRESSCSGSPQTCSPAAGPTL